MATELLDDRFLSRIIKLTSIRLAQKSRSSQAGKCSPLSREVTLSRLSHCMMCYGDVIAISAMKLHTFFTNLCYCFIELFV